MSSTNDYLSFVKNPPLSLVEYKNEPIHNRFHTLGWGFLDLVRLFDYSLNSIPRFETGELEQFFSRKES